ncbi:hypothetical protein ASZ90_006345 [hydrocarbon metagenome]|uniref:Uncharacterized protein n=1 Tax=hydrocarbon metagenome TaxID=938273 RepID=A0A0W8FSU7_9ZZZZ
MNNEALFYFLYQQQFFPYKTISQLVLGRKFLKKVDFDNFLVLLQIFLSLFFHQSIH